MPLMPSLDKKGDGDRSENQDGGSPDPPSGAWEVGAYYEAAMDFKVYTAWGKALERPVTLPTGHVLLARKTLRKARPWSDGQACGITKWTVIRLVCFDPRYPLDSSRILNVDMLVDGREKLVGLPFAKVESPLVALAMAETGLV